MRRMSLERWWDRFVPTGTPVEGADSGPMIGSTGRMFETYGGDLATVQAMARQHPERVWTYVDDGSRFGAITPGMRMVNRMGYFISEKPCVDPLREVKV